MSSTQKQGLLIEDDGNYIELVTFNYANKTAVDFEIGYSYDHTNITLNREQVKQVHEYLTKYLENNNE